jgi:hypothetical protein
VLQSAFECALPVEMVRGGINRGAHIDSPSRALLTEHSRMCHVYLPFVTHFYVMFYLISLLFSSQALRLGSDFRPPVPQAAGRDRDRDRDSRGIQNSRSSGSLKLNLSRGTAEMGQRRTLPPSSTSSSSLLSLTQGQSTADPSSTFKIQFR